MLADKDKINTDLETAEKDRLMRANNIPEDGVLRPIGASGAEVRSDASGVSSMAQSQRSTATINLENSYKVTKLNLAKEKGANAMKDAALAKERERAVAMDAENERLRKLFAKLAGTDVDVDAVLQAGTAPSPQTTATMGRRVTIGGGAARGSMEVEVGDQDTGDHINGPESPPEGE